MNNGNYDIVANDFDNLRNGSVGVYEILNIIKQYFNNPNVLDLGCGTGFPIGIQVSRISSKYIGIDNSIEMIKQFQKNIPNANCIHLDMVDIDHINDQFDLIYAWGAVCHLNIVDQEILFKKVRERLNDNGIFAFTSGEENEKCFGSVGKLSIIHYSLGKIQYKQIGNDNGLELINANYCSGNFYFYQFRKTAQQGDAPEPASPAR